MLRLLPVRSVTPASQKSRSLALNAYLSIRYRRVCVSFCPASSDRALSSPAGSDRFPYPGVPFRLKDSPPRSAPGPPERSAPYAEGQISSKSALRRRLKSFPEILRRTFSSCRRIFFPFCISFSTPPKLSVSGNSYRFYAPRKSCILYHMRGKGKTAPKIPRREKKREIIESIKIYASFAYIV